MKTSTVVVQETEEGELFIEIPSEILEAAGLKVCQPIEWVDNKDGSWTIRGVNHEP